MFSLLPEDKISERPQDRYRTFTIREQTELLCDCRARPFEKQSYFGRAVEMLEQISGGAASERIPDARWHVHAKTREKGFRRFFRRTKCAQGELGTEHL